MNSIAPGRAVRERVRALAGWTAWDWRRCPTCQQTETWRHGRCTRHPWTRRGRQTLVVPRHWCRRCRARSSDARSSEQSALVARGRWSAREVERCAIDHCQHVGSSVRRTADLVRSLLGRQARWRTWQPLADAPPAAQRGRLGASTVQRWVELAGAQAERTLPDNWRACPPAANWAPTACGHG